MSGAACAGPVDLPGMLNTSAPVNPEGFSALPEGLDPSLGSGDGRIHIVPMISSYSVKNGNKLTISAIVKAEAGVDEVEADLGGIDTTKLQPSSRGVVGSNGLGKVCLYTAEWTGHDLEEKVYTMTFRVFDKLGHVFEDSSVQFSDPLVGITVEGTAVGTTTYPALQWVAALTLNTGENSPTCAVIDETNQYAYFGTNTSPGIVVKVALGSGASAPTRVGALTLNTGENSLTSAVIDTTNQYAYFGTSTSPGIVVKVNLNGAGTPTRTGAVTLSTGEDTLMSAVIDTTNQFAYFGTDTSPGIVVKVALGSGSNAPTRSAAVTLNTGENKLRCA